MTSMNLKDLLSKTNSQEVADFLERYDIKGVRGQPTNCPVANCLKKLYPMSRIYTNKSRLIAWIHLGYGFGEIYQLDLPTTAAIGYFIHDFDEGEYPNLEK